MRCRWWAAATASIVLSAQAFSAEPYLHTIGGKQVNSASSLAVLNPATEAKIATCPDACADEVASAVAAASAAFPAWSATPLEQRRARLLALAERILEHKDELQRLELLEKGSNFPSIDLVARNIRALAETLELSDEALISNEAQAVTLSRRPLGVVAAIAPWNAPLVIGLSKVAAALITGNTVVLKPSPHTPLATLRVAALASDVLPPGVFNAISGGDAAGAALVSDPTVAMVSFTGSVASGKKIARACSERLARCSLELGGNDAAIVLPDVDVPATAIAIFWGAMAYQGQNCFAIKRLYVHAAIADEMATALVQIAQAAAIGDPADAATQMGPLQNRPQYERVMALLEQLEAAEAAGEARVRCGGLAEVRATWRGKKGYFVPPTIVDGLAESSPLVSEEQFGPVLPVLSFTDVDDAVARANSGWAGLCGSVWTKNVDEGRALAQRLDVGTAWVNQHGRVDPTIPFAGRKESALGVTYGRLGLEEFMSPFVLNVKV